MNTKLFYSFWVVLFLLLACTEPERTNGTLIIDSESQLKSYEARSIKGSNLKLKGHSLLGAFDLLLQNDTLVVCYPYGKPYYFDALSVSQELFLGSFIREGGGPGEYAGALMNSFSKPDNGLISISQRGYEGELVEYKLSDLIQNPKALPVNKVSFPDLIGFMQLSRIDENTLVALTFRSDTPLTIFDTNGNKVRQVLKYPFADEMTHISKNALSLAFQSKLVINNNGGIGVFSMTSPNWDILYFKDGETEKVSSVHLRKPEVIDQSTDKDGESINSIAFLDSNKDGFLDVCNTDEFIYALYSGKSYKEHGNDIQFSRDVLVFNWQGELVDRLELDRDTRAIEVEKDEYLVSLVEESDESLIRKYQLK